MPETLLDLAFGKDTLNDPQTIEKFSTDKYDRFAQDMFRMHGTNIGPDRGDRKQLACWKEYTFSREPAPFGHMRSAGTALEGLDETEKTSPLAQILIESQPIPIDEITSPVAAQNILAREFRNYQKRKSIAKELYAWQTLKGTVAINPTTVPGSKVSFAETWGVTSWTSGANWATPTTKLLSSELDTYLQGPYHDACGLESKRIIADRLVKGYIRGNSEVQTFVSHDPNPANRLVTMERVMGPAFEGFNLNGFHFDVHGTKYSKSGTLTKYLGDNGAIALPGDDELPMVLGYAEGYGSIPREAIGMNPNSMGERAQQAGDFFYAYTTPRPAAVILVFGWLGYYALTWPEAVAYNDDVTSTS